MIAVDTNLLVYAHREDSEWHESARDCLDTLVAGRASWAIVWTCLHEFYSIVTHPRIYDPPTPTDLAIDQLTAWLEANGREAAGSPWEVYVSDPGEESDTNELVTEVYLLLKPKP